MSESVSVLEGPERLLGSRVLDFELKAVVGIGGMSVVYRGQHRVTQQEVAIKILPPELAVHEELKARFVEEARVLARLEHPNIVQLNNFTEAGGRLCLIMQYVEGVTFEAQIVQKRQIAVHEAVRVGIEVCRALEYAHAQGCVHRDIKPSNIVVRRDGSVKVTDFGIAKFVGATRLTSTGQTMGTVRYMSPEQVRGRAADARSDLYSLGITLYEALAGRCPFDGESQFDIMQQHLHDRPPPLSKFGLTIPPLVEQVLWAALEKDAAHRYADATSFRGALEQLLPAATGLRAPPLRTRRSRLPPALGLAALIGVGASVTFFVARGLEPRETAPAPAQTPKGPRWPSPHTLAGVALATDARFPSDGLRVQSVQARDADQVRGTYRRVLEALRDFCTTTDVPAVRDLGQRFAATPLNLVLLPQALLDAPRLWPQQTVAADSTYPSRYDPEQQTLFVNDTPGFEWRDLPYGVALHVLTPLPSLANADLVRLAERFEVYYNKRRSP